MLIDIVSELILAVTALNGSPFSEVETDTYSRIRLADSCYVEVVTYPDSFLVVETVCVPQCNSRAYVYNKEWQRVHEVLPAVESQLPYAYFENDTLMWKDNNTRVEE